MIIDKIRNIIKNYSDYSVFIILIILCVGLGMHINKVRQSKRVVKAQEKKFEMPNIKYRVINRKKPSSYVTR